MDSPELTIRRIPEQKRARETFEHVLATAADLLDEVGIDEFNTNLLADRAGVRVRTVYRYFPNKLAIITTLAERMVDEWNDWFGELELIADPASDWRACWCAMIRRFVAGVRQIPGGRGVRRAMHAVPGLWEIDQRDNEQLARRVAQVLRARVPSMSAPEAEAIGRTLLESAVASVDLALVESPARSKRLIEQLERMHVAYLATWLDE